ncbi:MAG: MBL fold metallo-hydrolase [Parcubacteria group bacterium]|nr:MBL fold metallo-hydrolase [Parcubacteria group bacterium]
MTQASITFYGGAGEVTGSNFLVEMEGTRILIDCGLFQGCPTCGEKNAAPFPYDPASIDAVLLTHAHIDHGGRIPKLVKDGFTGTVISTPPTKELSALMFEDALEVMAEESRRGGAQALYGRDDIARALGRWEVVPYHKKFNVKNVGVSLRDAGHILGSAMVELTNDGGSVVFSGDLGNSPTPLLRDTEPLPKTDYIVMESVYGDREHETPAKRRGKLEDVIEETARADGALLISAFSLERMQEILYEIEHMAQERRIPHVPVVLDSPLGIKVTEIYKKYADYFNEDVRRAIEHGEDIFSFPQLRFTGTMEESRAIADMPSPKIIIAGSGMSAGGRVLYHEKRYLPEPRNTLLFVGYQAPGSLGREILEGARRVSIFGETVPVNARVESISGYSSHKDSEALLAFASQAADSVRAVYVVMGEPKASTFLAQRLRDYVGMNAFAPQAGETVTLEF